MVAAALAAGCSSTSDGPSASSTTTASGTSAPASTTTTKASTGTSTAGGADATAESALIAASDLGAGWSEDVASTTPESFSVAFLAVPACADLVPDAGTGTASEGAAMANYTTTGSDLQVQYQVDIYPTAADASAMVELLESPQFGPCLGAVLTKESPNATIGEVTSSPLSIGSAADLGIDGAAGVEASAAVTAEPSGTGTTVQVQVVVLQHGNALGIFTVTRAAPGGDPAPIDVNQDTVKAAATKIASIGS